MLSDKLKTFAAKANAMKKNAGDTGMMMLKKKKMMMDGMGGCKKKKKK